MTMTMTMNRKDTASHVGCLGSLEHVRTTPFLVAPRTTRAFPFSHATPIGSLLFVPWHDGALSRHSSVSLRETGASFRRCALRDSRSQTHDLSPVYARSDCDVENLAMLSRRRLALSHEWKSTFDGSTCTASSSLWPRRECLDTKNLYACCIACAHACLWNDNQPRSTILSCVIMCNFKCMYSEKKEILTFDTCIYVHIIATCQCNWTIFELRLKLVSEYVHWRLEFDLIWPIGTSKF